MVEYPVLKSGLTADPTGDQYFNVFGFSNVVHMNLILIIFLKYFFNIVPKLSPAYAQQSTYTQYQSSKCSIEFPLSNMSLSNTQY